MSLSTSSMMLCKFTQVHILTVVFSHSLFQPGFLRTAMRRRDYDFFISLLDIKTTYHRPGGIPENLGNGFQPFFSIENFSLISRVMILPILCQTSSFILTAAS